VIDERREDVRTPATQGAVRHVFISAAEPSADLHGASLIKAIRAMDPAIRFSGVAGPRMRDAGCEAIFDMTAHAAMLGGVFRAAPRALAMLRACKRAMRSERYDLAIVIDSPLLHLPLAKRACGAGVPVLYYIAPQLWAWGERRIKRLRARVARMAVILPFEEEYFAARGLRAEYVGNPLMDTLAARLVDTELTERIRAKGKPVICILPGSREHVVKEVLPGQIEVAEGIAARFADAHFCVSVANDRVRPLIESRLRSSTIPSELYAEQNGEILSAADFALVASGTATLEAAYYHVPMVVMYNATRLGYHLIGRWFLRTRVLSLVNIVAGRRIVPEFMPFYRTTEPIIDEALRQLNSPDELAGVRKALEGVISQLAKPGAANHAARIVLEMLETKAPG
jgi:lipid-A-disaccharide synthase